MLSIVVSAGVGAVVALLLDTVRWRREDRRRWAPERRQAYGAFLAAVNRWEELDYEAAANGELEEWFEAPPEDRFEPLTGVHTSSRIRPRANAAAATAYERLTDLQLVGSNAVWPLAQHVCEQMRALSNVRYVSPPRDCGGSSDDHNEATNVFIAARDAFVEAVRTDLGSD